jgi:pimeloyl-ACP methyl ester carboxylesterase
VHAKSKKGPTVPEFLTKHADGKTIWLTGHSLGGAIATIAAARIEAPDSPFKGRLGGLFTIGSPRALNSKGAKALMATLGTNKVFRIVRARDPIPLVPRLRYKHVSGTRVFVTNKGDLVIGSSKWKQRAESLLCWLQGVEDALGSVLPGQHHGLIGLISHHSSADYFKAVDGWNPANKHSIRGILGMTLAPIKIVLAMVVGVGVAWAVWSSCGTIMMRMFG